MGENLSYFRFILMCAIETNFSSLWLQGNISMLESLAFIIKFLLHKKRFSALAFVIGPSSLLYRIKVTYKDDFFGISLSLSELTHKTKQQEVLRERWIGFCLLFIPRASHIFIHIFERVALEGVRAASRVSLGPRRGPLAERAPGRLCWSGARTLDPSCSARSRTNEMPAGDFVNRKMLMFSEPTLLSHFQHMRESCKRPCH